MNQGPMPRYRSLIEAGSLDEDPAQQEAVVALQALYECLSRGDSTRGMYLWGEVGRGKTRIMDLFYEACSEPYRVLRCHFHAFMRRIHRGLAQAQGREEPLTYVAKQLADEYRLICLDEFFVSDIGDAMILYRLLDALFQCGVILVATSNTAISELYKDGLHRARFEPAIGLLNFELRALHMDGVKDHRLRKLHEHTTYYVDGRVRLEADFTELTSGPVSHAAIEICGRSIEVVKSAASLIWFEFDALCDGPRSQLDYIDIAALYPVVFISGIPALGGEPVSQIKARGTEDGAFAVTETGEREVKYAKTDNAARRFISLVDELYNQGVNLYLSADVGLEQLYPSGALSFEFKRTYSRLREMQSEEYLGAGRTITTSL